MDAVGLAAAEEGMASPPASRPVPSPRGGKVDGVEGKGGEGEGQQEQKLSYGLVWRAVKQIVMGRALNVLLLTLPFGALSGALPVVGCCVCVGGG